MSDGFGLSWGSLDLEVMQRGFFFILLKAFMKARHMGLGLLFQKGKAFRNYVDRLPMPPLAVPTFLSALHRLVDLVPGTRDYKNLYKQTLYDLLKTVRLGLEVLTEDWTGPERYYQQHMGSHYLFCSSCGYESFEEFFSGNERHLAPQRRRCAACYLIGWLDMEHDHLKLEFRDVLTSLFPDWTGMTINVDAPIPAEGARLIRLATSETVRPPPPPMVAYPNGTFHQPQYSEPNVRDRKAHLDSLQQLPTFGELVNKAVLRENWGDANEKCVNLELFRRCVTVLGPDRLHGDALRAFHTNPIDEPQYHNVNLGKRIQSYDFREAVRVLLVLQMKGYY
jgi:hypothetical protein